MTFSFVLLALLGVLMTPTPVLSQLVGNPNPYAQQFDATRTFITDSLSTEATTCPTPGVSTPVAPAYPSTYTYSSTTACLQPYEKLARAPSGAVRCNVRDGSVKATARSSTTLYPALNTKGTGNVEQCVSEGVYQHPEANAVLVAQCVFSFVVIIICAILALIRTWQHLSVFVRAWFLFMMVTCILLLPSFYYLNGLIGTGAAILAVVMFSTRDSNAVAIGMTACIAAVMWFTFESGLGALTHSIRLTNPMSADPAQSLYEGLCDGYYRFSYHVSLPVSQDVTNPVEPGYGVCVRGWLAAELFFSVFLILSLVVLAAAGAHALSSSRIVANPIAEDSHKRGSA